MELPNSPDWQPRNLSSIQSMKSLGCRLPGHLPWEGAPRDSHRASCVALAENNNNIIQPFLSRGPDTWSIPRPASHLGSMKLANANASADGLRICRAHDAQEHELHNACIIGIVRCPLVRVPLIMSLYVLL